MTVAVPKRRGPWSSPEHTGRQIDDVNPDRVSNRLAGQAHRQPDSTGELRAEAANRTEEICRELLPAGKRVRDEWQVGNTQGDPGKSMRIQLDGPEAGLWIDHASPDDKGDVLDLWMQVRNVDFPTAKRQISDFLEMTRVSVPIPRCKPDTGHSQPPSTEGMEPIVEGSRAWRYLTEDRGLDPEILAEYSIMQSEDGGTVVYPTMSKSGRLLSTKSELVDRSGGRRLWQSKDGEKNHFFGWQTYSEKRAVDPETGCRAVVITEGEIDAMTVAQSGSFTVSLPSGASNLKCFDLDADLLEEFDAIHVATDADDTGNACAEKIADLLGRSRCLRVKFDSYKDANEAVTSGGWGGSDIYDAIRGAVAFSDRPESSVPELPPEPTQEAKNGSDWPEPITAQDLCARPMEPPAILIDGMLYQGGTMLLVGGSKAKKTWTMTGLGMAVASGHSWFGYQTTQTTVLYLNLELPEFDFRKRLVAIAKEKDMPVPPDLHVWNLRGTVVTIDDLEKMLRAYIVEHGIGLCIIDPHYKISATSGYEENSNDSQGKLLTRIEAVTSRNGAAVAITHHFAKGRQDEKDVLDLASGGGVFARWPDAFMAMRPHKEDEAMVLETRLRSFSPIGAKVLRWSFPAWVEDGALDPADLRKTGRPSTYAPEKLLEVLADGMTWSEWKSASKWANTTFNRGRDTLIDKEKITQQDGRYFRSK